MAGRSLLKSLPRPVASIGRRPTKVLLPACLLLVVGVLATQAVYFVAIPLYKGRQHALDVDSGDDTMAAVRPTFTEKSPYEGVGPLTGGSSTASGYNKIVHPPEFWKGDQDQPPAFSSEYGRDPGGFERIRPARRKRVIRDRRKDAEAAPADCRQRPGRDYNSTAGAIWIYLGAAAPSQATPVNGRYDHVSKVMHACTTPCISVPGSQKDQADVYVTLIAGGYTPKAGHCPLEMRAVFSLENEAWYSDLMLTEANFATSDFLGTFRLDSDVPTVMGGWYEYNFMEAVRPKTATKLATAAISNCGARNNRLEYMRELIAAGVGVDSYGRCDNNAQWHGSGNWFKDKIDMMASHKFSLVFENSLTDDGVTEKWYGALVAGSVPIYMGARNIMDFAPSDYSFIAVSDYPSAKELAEYLFYLDKNDDEYNKYLEWKITGPSAKFERLMRATSDTHSQCRMCWQAKELLQKQLQEI